MKAEVSKMQDTEKRFIQSTLSNNIGFSSKNLDFEQKELFSLNEEKSIYVFLKFVEEKSLGLDQLLMHYDKDNDLHIFKNEMINILEEIKLPMDDRQAVIKLAGFIGNKIKMPIKTIIDNFYKREERKYSKLNEILFKIAYLLHNKYIEIENLYTFLKLNDENTLNYIELKQGLNSADIILSEIENETLFRCLSIKEDNKINLDELIDKLKIRKSIIDDIGNIGNKIRYSQGKSTNIVINSPIKKYDNIQDIDNNYNLDDNNVDVNIRSSIGFMSNQDKEDDTLQNTTFNQNIKNLDKTLVDDTNTNNNKEEEEVVEEIKIPENEDNISNNNISYNNDNSNEGHSVNNQINNTNTKGSNKSIGLMKDSSNNDNKLPNKNKKQSLLDIKIDGELKIQVKAAEDIILPKTIKKPYSFFITLSLDGANDEKRLDSRDISVESTTLVLFNWAARIPLIKKTLKEVGCYFKLELNIKSGNIPFVKLGECLINWTSTVQPQNFDKFVLDDKFQLLCIIYFNYSHK